MKPQVVIESVEMKDPTFDGGVTKVAKAIMTNPTSKQLTYKVELYLGVSKAATSGLSEVTIPAGGSAQAVFTIITPTVEGEYPVFLDVWYDTTLLKHYQATESVVITVTPDITVGPITWE